MVKKIKEPLHIVKCQRKQDDISKTIGKNYKYKGRGYKFTVIHELYLQSTLNFVLQF